MLFIIASTWGNGTSDFTDGSHVTARSALSSASPLRALFAGSSTHRAASTTCSGLVDAIRICVSNWSG